MRDAIDWADLHTLRALEVPHTLGAARGIDDVEIIAGVNGLIRARRFAHIAVHTVICDHQRHRRDNKSLRFGAFAEAFVERLVHDWMNEFADIAAE